MGRPIAGFLEVLPSFEQAIEDLVPVLELLEAKLRPLVLIDLELMLEVVSELGALLNVLDLVIGKQEALGGFAVIVKREAPREHEEMPVGA